MREIKFRAWNKKYKKMKAVEHLYLKAKEIYVEPDDIGDTCMWFWVDCDVMQYTGLKDKDGNEIYEGDIIKYIATEQIEVVEWETRGECSCGCFSGFALTCTPGQYEIIGNSHENPELMDEAKK